MARSTSPHPSISLMDIFIGSGRTIRRPTGPPGIHPTRKTELVQVRPRKGSGDSKPATPVKPSSKKAIAGSDAKSNSKKEEAPAAPKSSSKKEESPSGSKPNSKKDDSPPDSKPSSSKEDIAPHESKPSSSKSDSKSNSKKDDSKANSKPTSAKAPSEEKAADDKEAGAKKSDGKKPEEPVASGSKPQANDQQPSDLIVFTAEEDAKLLLMKANGDNWNDIAAAINKSKKQTTRRFGEIKPGDWKAQKGGKHGIDKGGVVAEMKKDKPSEKQLSKVPKKDDKAVEVKPKPNAVEKMRKPEDAPTALLLAGKVQHQHDVRHRHAHQHDHHIHVHDTHESRPRREPHDTHESRPRRDKDRTHESRPRHRTQPVLDPTDSGYGSNHRSRRPRAPPSVAASTAYTVKTMPSLTEDDLFSFGELQALSELIGKDMEGMWHRVSAAFFGMTGRRIPAEDIKEKFEGLEVE